MFLSGFGISAYLTVLKFLGHPIGNRPLLFLGLLLIIFGIQLLTTGLLGEMLARPELERRDRFHIAEHVGLKAPPRQHRETSVMIDTIDG